MKCKVAILPFLGDPHRLVVNWAKSVHFSPNLPFLKEEKKKEENKKRESYSRL